MLDISLEDLQNFLLNMGKTPIGGSPIAYRPIKPISPLPGQPVGPQPIQGLFAVLNTPGANPSGKNGIPLQLLTVQAVQTPVKQQSYVNCNVTVNFTYNTQDKNFYAVNIWFVGYHGSNNPTLMASGTSSPINFICDATLETVSVYAQTVSSTGMSAPVLFATHCTVTLSGTIGAPPAPSISQSLVGTPTGYQFAFNQVILPVGDEEVISNYNIYRSEFENSSTAHLIGTVVPNPKLTGAITFTDTITVATGEDYFYWVSAVNTAGFESTLTPAQSGPVAGSVGSIPPSLSTPFKIVTTSTSVTISTSPSCFFTRADGSTTLVGATSTACTGLPTGNTVYFFPYWDDGSQTLKFVLNSDVTIPNITGITCASASSQYIETTTSGSIPTAFSVEMWVKGTAVGALFDFSAPQLAGTTTSSICQAQVITGGEVEFSLFNGSTWASVTTAGASVLDSTWHHILCTYASGVGTVFVDGVYTSDGTTFWQNNSMGVPATTSGWWHWGFIGGKAGAPVTTNKFNSFTMSHIALYDAALAAIQAVSHLQAFCNLGEAFYIQEVTYDSAVNFWELTETSGTVAADAIGTNTGTYKNSPTLNQTSPVVTVLGTPLIAWPFNALLAIQAQTLRNHVPLSLNGVSANTSNPGVGGGGGGGGGGGFGGRGGICFSPDTLVITQRGDVPFSDLTTDDLVLTARGTWRPITYITSSVWEGQLVDLGKAKATPGHLLLAFDKWQPARAFGLPYVNYSGKVMNMEVETDPDDDGTKTDTEHSYTLSNGFIAHNNGQQSCN